MSDGFLRQRRNLMGSTLLVLLILILGVSFTAISPMGVKISISENPFIPVPIILAIVHFYFIYRYATYWYDESLRDDYKGYDYSLDKKIKNNLYEKVSKTRYFPAQGKDEGTNDYLARVEMEKKEISRLYKDGIISQLLKKLGTDINQDIKNYDSLTSTEKQIVDSNLQGIGSDVKSTFNKVINTSSPAILAKPGHNSIMYKVTDEDIEKFKKDAFYETYIFSSFTSNYVLPALLSAVAFLFLINFLVFNDEKHVPSKKENPLMGSTYNINIVISNLVDKNVTNKYILPISMKIQISKDDNK